jgi:gliding motility-associated-like protein
VTLPGKYYVTVTDFCGNIKSDTIVVSPPKNVSFNFQLLYEKCSIDTIKIAIPALVKNIVFHPFEGVNYNEEIIKAFPSKNTFYYVKAKTIEGCYLTDSFNIKVNESIPVSLGNDTAICEGNTLALEPSAEFLTYHWSDGASSSSKIVNSTGKYWIEVTGKNQCTSSDTIAVTVNPAPLVNLGKDKSICPEAVYTLDPGNTYASYLWQDGSNGSTYKAGQLGAYSVIVTDENGCSGSDTVNIVAYKNVPSNFLNKTDSVCAYEPKEVYAKGDWNSYLWSNGSTSRSTIIKEAGTYWLEVSNSDGCHAKDTIDVKRKDCINGIYFPSAFTPNQDGKNDLYKPIVHVSLDKYYLVIYNRFGQKVFETTDLGKGWNGTLNSLQQDTGGVYVWYCKYKITGLAERTEKGTLVLIR